MLTPTPGFSTLTDPGQRTRLQCPSMSTMPTTPTMPINVQHIHLSHVCPAHPAKSDSEVLKLHNYWFVNLPFHCKCMDFYCCALMSGICSFSRAPPCRKRWLQWIWACLSFFCKILWQDVDADFGDHTADEHDLCTYMHIALSGDTKRSLFDNLQCAVCNLIACYVRCAQRALEEGNSSGEVEAQETQRQPFPSPSWLPPLLIHL